MKYIYQENAVESALLLRINEDNFDKYFFKNRNERLLTIAWNRGQKQTAWIDEVEYHFPKNSILALMVNQSFRFERPEDLVSWQFNREFYCIVDHDREVSCVGFLFYGMRDLLFINLDQHNITRFDLLVRVFIDEFQTQDNVQGEMLRMMLKRLIIIITRLAKEQSLTSPMKESDFDIVRKFNLSVENHYKTKHQVQDYADLLNKSPKTLSNLFLIYNQKNPLQIIHERISLEAKRLMIYTDKSTKEIAYELGFEEVAHFSRFFKKVIGQNPTDFKTEMRKH